VDVPAGVEVPSVDREATLDLAALNPDHLDPEVAREAPREALLE
jgi:hypothetical protein